MKARGKTVAAGVLIIVPALTAGLWMASGREVLTKGQKAIQVEVADDLFGDTFPKTEFVRGPILGYYVGLDAVTGATGVCVVVGLGLWWWRRRQTRRAAKRMASDAQS